MPILTNEMKREIILDHYSDPNNKKTPLDLSNYKAIRMDSDSCIDDITIYIKTSNNKVIDACFDGIACAISTASTDILCDLIKDKTEEEVKEIIEAYHHMLHEEEYDDSILDELNAFSETYKQAARIKCASLGANGIESLIEDKKDE